MFSGRIPSDFTPNHLTTLLAERRLRGEELIDLTPSNPTRADLSYPADLLRPLSAPEGLVYAPEALGVRSARAAVASDYARRGLTVPIERIALTASTSEAYSVLFKLLCDPGDEVLIPHPSYPLFEHLTRLDAITSVPYDLEYHGTWTINVPMLARQVTPRTRAVLVVSPNNPTGSYVSAREVERLSRDDDRPVAVAHRRAVRQQRVAIRDVRVRARRDRRHLESALDRPLVQRRRQCAVHRAVGQRHPIVCFCSGRQKRIRRF